LAAGLVKTFQGHVPKLLRHPCGFKVVNELYTNANGRQRRCLSAEFYGREMLLFGQVPESLLQANSAHAVVPKGVSICELGCLDGQESAPKRLEELLRETDATGRQKIVQQLGINLIPIMEKGLLDPVIVHGWASLPVLSACRGLAMRLCVCTHAISPCGS
jgi:hypothetical protein